jgi:hypothetical protein|tara:strand:- start:29746 stop:31935 length:2190 start_codon:yes stop_codon:yes gene_type:complete
LATLVLSTVGTLVGGPLGGALGALVGRTIDQTVLFRPRDREGPRLTDLAVQSSQYGSPFAHVHGRVRIAGTVIWATDLKERKVREGGGKGRPGTTRYSYSVSFAVALSARPIEAVGRIWAEGNLLRGQDGVFTSETGFRLHLGHDDQPLDPLIAAAEGPGQCPAYRGLAYAVFEDMALEEFGNRIPSLTFEVIGSAEDVALGPLIADLTAAGVPEGDGSVTGWSLPSESRRDAVQAIAAGFPVSLVEQDGKLRTIWRENARGPVSFIPESALLPRDASDMRAFERQRTAPTSGALALRYYDPERDYQPGLRRSGSSGSGRAQQIDVPAVMTAARAQQRVEQLVQLDRDGLERLHLRVTLFDPALQPGRIVTVEGVAGHWRVQHWQWRAEGIDLALVSLRTRPSPLAAGSDPGRSVNTPDAAIGATVLALFDLPSPMDRPMNHPHIAIAVAGASAGWRGATVYTREADGSTGEPLDFLRVGATMGEVLVPPTHGTALLRDDRASITVRLVRDGPLVLANADDDALASGANMAMVGAELLQFARVEPLGNRTFRLTRLLRGRGGTEDWIADHSVGEGFVLLTEALGVVDPDRIGPGPDFRAAAQGRGDGAPVHAALAGPGRAVRPLSPVHGRIEREEDGDLTIRWTRRSRSGFAWRDLLDAPLGEEFEAYRVSILADGIAVAAFECASPMLVLDTVTVAALAAAASELVEASIVQHGAFGVSPPLIVPLEL